MYYRLEQERRRWIMLRPRYEYLEQHFAEFLKMKDKYLQLINVEKQERKTSMTDLLKTSQKTTQVIIYFTFKFIFN